LSELSRIHRLEPFFAHIFTARRKREGPLKSIEHQHSYSDFPNLINIKQTLLIIKLKSEHPQYRTFSRRKNKKRMIAVSTRSLILLGSSLWPTSLVRSWILPHQVPTKLLSMTPLLRRPFVSAAASQHHPADMPSRLDSIKGGLSAAAAFSSMDINFQQGGFATKNQIQAHMSKSNAILVDVRSQEEIETQGKFDTTTQKLQWVHSQCTLDECPTLTDQAQTLFPDKQVPIVIHCASGKRAAKAKQVLESQGYTNVLNAGGLADLVETMKH
jgi:phage shock protein E